MKLSKNQFIVFNIFLLVGGQMLTINNYILKNLTNVGFIYPLLILPILIIISFFYKQNRIKVFLNKPIIKTILCCYLIISSFIITLNYLVITNDYFYKLTPPFIILIILLIISIYLSTYGLKNIIFVGFIFSIAFFFLSAISFLFTSKLDLNLLTKMNFHINSYLKLFNYLFLYLDILILPLFLNYKLNYKDNCKIYIISCLIQFLMLFILYLLYLPNFFPNIKIPFLSFYLTTKSTNLIEHCDLLYLILVSIYFIFKIGINNEIFRINLKIKRKDLKNFLFSLIIIILTYLSSFFKMNHQIINYLMFFSSLMIFLLIIINRGFYERN